MLLPQKLISSLVFVSLFFSLSVFADDKIPDWLKRMEYSVKIETDKQPIFYFQTIQPLYQTEDKINTWFIQPRVSLRGGNLTYNLGLGYRALVSENILLGANIFGDYQHLHEHGRLGAGFEVLGNILEARLNTYFGVTSKRVVEETPTNIIYERVADGLDFELGTPLPYLPWLKVYGQGFWYDFNKSSDKKGWKVRLEAKPSDYLTLEFYTWDDNKGKIEMGGRVRVNIPFDSWTDFKDLFKLAKEPYPSRDLKEYTLIPVERNFDIVVEKWSENKTTGVTIEIKRAN